jgi:hypothetical protein
VGTATVCFSKNNVLGEARSRYASPGVRAEWKIRVGGLGLHRWMKVLLVVKRVLRA